MLDAAGDEASWTGMLEDVKSPIGYKYSIISLGKSCLVFKSMCGT